jgi:asparagine synthase (glutamine-hydrolysing)
MKLKDGVPKHIFKRAVGHLLPPELLTRKKMGFGVPLDHWFRGDFRELAHDVLLGLPMRQRGYFNIEAVRRMIDEHATGAAEWHDQLWNLLMLESWHQMFIDRRPAAPPRAAHASAVPTVAAC